MLIFYIRNKIVAKIINNLSSKLLIEIGIFLKLPSLYVLFFLLLLLILFDYTLRQIQKLEHWYSYLSYIQ